MALEFNKYSVKWMPLGVDYRKTFKRQRNRMGFIEKYGINECRMVLVRFRERRMERINRQLLQDKIGDQKQK